MISLAVCYCLFGAHFTCQHFLIQLRWRILVTSRDKYNKTSYYFCREILSYYRGLISNFNTTIIAPIMRAKLTDYAIDSYWLIEQTGRQICRFKKIVWKIISQLINIINQLEIFQLRNLAQISEKVHKTIRWLDIF